MYLSLYINSYIEIYKYNIQIFFPNEWNEDGSKKRSNPYQNQMMFLFGIVFINKAIEISMDISFYFLSRIP